MHQKTDILVQFTIDFDFQLQHRFSESLAKIDGKRFSIKTIACLVEKALKNSKKEQLQVIRETKFENI